MPGPASICRHTRRNTLKSRTVLGENGRKRGLPCRHHRRVSSGPRQNTRVTYQKSSNCTLVSNQISRLLAVQGAERVTERNVVRQLQLIFYDPALAERA